MEDCCEYCPEPIDDSERELQAEEDKNYIRGRITFIQENPGRQIMTGSFKPIDVGEWSAQAYIGPTNRFFTAISINDRTTVTDMIKNGTDVNRRDHVGRSPLHFAIMCNATDIACDLVDAGARMTARLVDGRTSLHLAVQHDQVHVVRKLLEKSAQNKERADTEGEVDDIETKVAIDDTEKERLSSEDDWSSDDDCIMEADNEDEVGNDENDNNAKENDKPGKDTSTNEEAEDADGFEGIPDDSDNVPDVFNLTAADWDHGLTPIAYAVIFASRPILEDLISSGADVKESTKSEAFDVHPLSLTAIRPDEDEACKIAERLISAGATSSLADSSFITVFWRVVATGKTKLVSTILNRDPNANVVINFPSIHWSGVILPVILAIRERNYALVTILLAYGAKLTIVEDDITRVLRTRPKSDAIYSHSTYLRRLTCFPIETAIARNDDLVRLLLALGAEVNVPIRECNTYYTSNSMKRSILDWVSSEIGLMDKRLEMEKEEVEEEEDKPEPIDLSKATSWKEYATLVANLRSQHSSVFVKKDASEKAAKVRRMQSIRDYLGDVKNLLLSVGAKTYREISTFEGQLNNPASLQNAETTAHPKIYVFEDLTFTMITTFTTITQNYDSDPLPKSEVPRYHELFQACFEGDDEKVHAFCLPAQGVESKVAPLQITVELARSLVNTNSYYKTGITPFAVAIANRKWDTARLILAIALAQYEKEKTDVKFSSNDIQPDDDESDCSDVSYMTVDQDTNDNYYIDISKQPSVVKCNVPPSTFLTMSRVYEDARFNDVRETLLKKALREDDIVAFAQILNMHDAFSINLAGIYEFIDTIIVKDNSDMLDELIRHTGAGINLTVIRRETTGTIATNDGNRLYLGLNIHGKKRMDLARRRDPIDMYDSQQAFPLLWKALVRGAEEIVDYLSSERPYNAYRAYAMSHNDERAECLRKVANLKELLPQWLGFKINTLGESPLTAAVLSGKLKIVKVLFAKHKQLMKAAVYEKSKPLSLNILQIAVRAHSEPETDLLDFLLAKNISPLEADTNGVNIYHFFCSNNKHDLLKYLLEKLPEEVNKALLTQQTGQQLVTPLHIATRSGDLELVKLILLHSTAATMIRDSYGNLPLHTSVSRCFPQITRLLINASPSTLFTENNFGDTALETISNLRLQRFLDTIRNQPTIECLWTTTFTDRSERFNLVHLEKELPLLRQTIDSLATDGKLSKDTKLYKELVAFADVMESHLRQLQQEPEVIKQSEKTDSDIADVHVTYDLIQEASNVTQGKRQLVHLIDVQQSVDRNLKSTANFHLALRQSFAEFRNGWRGLEKERTIEERSFVESKISPVWANV